MARDLGSRQPRWLTARGSSRGHALWCRRPTLVLIEHIAAPDARASGLTRCPRSSGILVRPELRRGARRARGYLPAIRLPDRCRPRRNGAKLNITQQYLATFRRLSNPGLAALPRDATQHHPIAAPGIARQQGMDCCGTIRGPEARRDVAVAQASCRTGERPKERRWVVGAQDQQH